jgi:hypothetical protein
MFHLQSLSPKKIVESSAHCLFFFPWPHLYPFASMTHGGSSCRVRGDSSRRTRGRSSSRLISTAKESAKAYHDHTPHDIRAKIDLFDEITVFKDVETMLRAIKSLARCWSRQDDDEDGHVEKHYEFGEVIGQGRSRVVYKCIERTTREQYACKKMPAMANAACEMNLLYRLQRSLPRGCPEIYFALKVHRHLCNKRVNSSTNSNIKKSFNFFLNTKIQKNKVKHLKIT